MRLKILAIIGISLLLPLETHALTLRCISNAITSNGKILSKSKATALGKRVVDTASTKLSQLKKDKASKSKIKKAKAALISAKANKSFIAACLRGESPLIEPFKSLIGTMTGNWNNNTFNTTGAISATFEKSGPNFSGTITIGGMLFGSIVSLPMVFSSDVSNATFPHRITIENTSIGKIDIDIAQNGDLSVANSGIPLVNLNRAEMALKRTATGFSGTFQSFLIGDVKLADGVVSVNK